MSDHHWTTGPTGDELEALRKQYDAMTGQQRGAEMARAKEAAAVNVNTYESFIDNGVHTLKVHNNASNETFAVRPIPDDHVYIEGIGQTTIKAAIAAGLLPHGWTHAQGFQQPAAVNSGKAAGFTSATPSAQEAPEAEPTDFAYSVRKQAVEASSATLTGLDEAIGADAVNQTLAQYAASGDLDFTMLPEGVTEAQAETVYSGYVASANHALAAVNSSVAMLTEMLPQDMLSTARAAVVNGHTDIVKELGAEASGRLARLPHRDPEGFRELLEGMMPEERKALKQDREGKWFVQLPNGQTMSFGAAVKLGIARF